MSELGKRSVGGNDQSVTRSTVGLIRCTGESGDDFELIVTYSMVMVKQALSTAPQLILLYVRPLDDSVRASSRATGLADTIVQKLGMYQVECDAAPRL